LTDESGFHIVSNEFGSHWQNDSGGRASDEGVLHFFSESLHPRYVAQPWRGIEA
jgi:hypothetical protein